MIEVQLPAPLCRLAAVRNPVLLDVPGAVTQRSVLDALESQYPALQGTTRDRASGRRRAYLRFFACGRDLSDAHPDEPLPGAVACGEEPFLVVGAMSGG